MILDRATRKDDGKHSIEMVSVLHSHISALASHDQEPVRTQVLTFSITTGLSGKFVVWCPRYIGIFRGNIKNVD